LWLAGSHGATMSLRCWLLNRVAHAAHIQGVRLMNKPMLMVPTLGALLASVALVGCNRQDDGGRADSTPGQKSDAVVAQAERQGERAQSRTSQATNEAKQESREAAQDAKQAGKQASEQAGGAVSDAVITASVNAGLAKDKNLSSLKIDVDTSGGRVAMHGTAPDAASRERATEIAQSVKGVVSVDNQLTVASK
jgi:hyperosmotically inducible protein